MYSTGNQYYINSNDRYTYKNRKAMNENYQLKRQQLRESLDAFRNDVRTFLVTEGVYNLLQEVLKDKSVAQKNYGKVLCENYVKENSAVKLLNKFSKSTCVLAETAMIINETYAKILEGVDDQNDLTFTIKPSDAKEFYKKLKDVPTENIQDTITKKTCAAAEEFVQNNINDKLEMEELAKKAKEKIDKVKTDSKELSDKIKQEHAVEFNLAKKRVGFNRKRSVYEQMAHNMTKAVVVNESTKEKFVTESGQLDVDSILEYTNTMYTFLEMLNISKIEKVDPLYIKNALNSIK